ncbi:MAG: hypothetical protein E7653_00085 [Ruminococcaceae bacterium]|nr:hypothetical protein [Oscillospiraceae bacterium]
MKRKIIIAISVMLVLVMALSSCGVNGKKIEQILNADYDTSADVYGEATNIAELDDYVVDATKTSKYFIVLAKADLEAATVTYKVLNLNTGKVVYTATSTATVVYEISTLAEIPAFAVVSTPVPAEGATNTDVDPTYYLYDATGAQVASTMYQPAAPYMVGDDFVVYNFAGYDVDDEGKFEKKVDIPEYAEVKGINASNDDYYYVLDDEEVVVYDKEFNVVSTWQAPSYVYDDGFNTTAVLNNGDIFVQYFVLLDEDATDFEVYDEDGKYDMVQVVVNAKTGKAKEIKLDYMVTAVYSNDYLYDEDEDNNVYTDKFDNLAIVFPVVDKNIDMTDMAMEAVLMGNNGKIKGALTYVENLVNVGRKIADDLYLVTTTTGDVIINGNGKVVKTLNNRLKFVGDYAYGDVAIYDLEFNVVYNLLENKAKIDGVIGDTIFVKVETDTGYQILAFNGGENKTVYTYNEEAETNNEFGTVGSVAYYILDTTSGEYTYYNANGDVMIKTTAALELVAKGEDAVIFNSVVDGVVKYYVTTVIENDAE